MSTDTIIMFKTAKLAKTKGYKYAYKFYNNNGKLRDFGMVSGYSNCTENNYAAPTQSMLQRWIRETHYIEVLPQNCIEYPLDKEFRKIGYGGSVYNSIIDTNFESFFGLTYEEAMEDGLIKALNLIK